MKRNSFLTRLFVLTTVFSLALQPVFVFAQTATPTPATVAVDPYTNKTLLDQARKQCQSTIASGGVSSVFNDDGAQIILQKSLPAISSGGGQVAVYDIGAIRQLNYLAWISSSNEALLKERNFSDDCFKVLAIANAQKALTKQLKTVQKNCVDSDCQNPMEVAKAIEKKNLEQAKASVEKTNSTWASEIKDGIAFMSERDKDSDDNKLNRAEVNDITSGKVRVNLDNYYEIGVKGNNPYTQTMKVVEYLREKNSVDIEQVYDEARWSGGVVASRKCTKTDSGANPEDVDFRAADCIAWEPQPILIRQEQIKQLINAPYNQAFSPSAELGLDGTLSNLNTRINNGTLFSQNVGDNFGSLTAGTSTSLLDAEKIKNQLINPATSTPPGTVTLGILIQDAVINLYESSTSSCIYVPITERQTTLIESKSKKIELEAYKTYLTTKWEEVMKNPKADYTNFFLKLSIDLSNKYSKTWLETLLNEAKDKATKCATAKVNYTTTASSTNPNVTVTTPQ